MDRGAWQATVYGVARVRHNWATKHTPHTNRHKDRTGICLSPKRTKYLSLKNYFELMNTNQILYDKIKKQYLNCTTLCNPMDSSIPSLRVHHKLLEFTQTRVHWVSDAIQPSHPLSSPSPPTFSLSQHQGFFKSGGQSIGVSASTSVLPMNIQGWFPLWWTGWISWQSKGISRVFPYTTVQKHQFFGAQLSL